MHIYHLQPKLDTKLARYILLIPHVMYGKRRIKKNQSSKLFICVCTENDPTIKSYLNLANPLVLLLILSTHL